MYYTKVLKQRYAKEVTNSCKSATQRVVTLEGDCLCSSIGKFIYISSPDVIHINIVIFVRTRFYFFTRERQKKGFISIYLSIHIYMIMTAKSSTLGDMKWFYTTHQRVYVKSSCTDPDRFIRMFYISVFVALIEQEKNFVKISHAHKLPLTQLSLSAVLHLWSYTMKF